MQRKSKGILYGRELTGKRTYRSSDLQFIREVYMQYQMAKLLD